MVHGLGYPPDCKSLLEAAKPCPHCHAAFLLPQALSSGGKLAASLSQEMLFGGWLLRPQRAEREGQVAPGQELFLGLGTTPVNSSGTVPGIKDDTSQQLGAVPGIRDDTSQQLGGSQSKAGFSQRDLKGQRAKRQE